MSSLRPKRIATPGDQSNDHYGGQLHDPKRLLTGFVNALGVLPPEIESGSYGKHCGSDIRIQDYVQMCEGE